MSKSTVCVGALAAALLVASAGAAAAQSSLPANTGSIPGSTAAEGENGVGDGTEDGGAGRLGELGELLPGSVTGSLPGYASGPLGSSATFACNVGSAAGLAANAIGAPLQVPVGVICAVLNPAARSTDALLAGDVDGSVSAVLSGVPLVGTSLADQLDTSSATESVEGSVGERLGSLTETSLSPAN